MRTWCHRRRLSYAPFDWLQKPMWRTTQFPPLQATEKKIKLLKISHHHLFTVKPIAPFKGAQKEREIMVNLGIYHRCEGRQKKIHPECHCRASKGLPSDARL